MNQHVPVLRAEVLEQLAIRKDGRYVDCTFGRGGHARAILQRLGPQGRLLAIDRDPAAVAQAERLAQQDPRVCVFHAPFSRLSAVLAQAMPGVLANGILADLGVSSPQLDDPQRGFSFSQDGPLDMRMNTREGVSAAEWLNTAAEGDIARVLRTLGEEPHAWRIARAIGQRRQSTELRSTGELAELVSAVVPRKAGQKHPATRCFQAIRIHINRELEELDALLEQSVGCLAPAGRLCVISFHSLEDRRVKRFLRDQSRVDPALAELPVVPESARPRLRIPARAIRPGAAEIAANPRARSATLRVGEKL